MMDGSAVVTDKARGAASRNDAVTNDSSHMHKPFMDLHFKDHPSHDYMQ